ncbi:MULTISPECIES: alpha/beta hydrolase family protein [Anaerotruncus]|uniref:alpha/beta hydrolase family protein n=1 Tax=Anaerotruncus TaxID=244127 RepID=UPI0009AC8275|nr:MULTISPECIES: alpha/beta fold hydrolase [Anaerotruncus]RGX55177.1 alpha/beta fold hydrolase [Anaerotruncus sp. AF02-27]
MFTNVEVVVAGRTIRGTVMTPDGNGPFPTVCFYHGFSVDRVGMDRLHFLFSKRCVEEGFACVRFDFYGCGESDGDFREKRVSFELEQTLAIYDWTAAQPFADPEQMFMVGHSLGGILCSMAAPLRQPKAISLWSPGLTAYYDISARIHAVPTRYKQAYSVGGLLLSAEFLTELRGMDIIGRSKGYRNKVLLVHGELDEKVPVYVVGPYADLYGEQMQVKIVEGANHQFSNWNWKQQVYDTSIAFLKSQL